MSTVKARLGLTGNQLKLIAMIAMTIDHIGAYLLPEYRILRIIGRLALPIYAYMIAEGCHYTHDRKRYLLRLAGLALVCQIVFWFFTGSLYQCILVSFSMAVLLIYLVDYAQERQTPAANLAAMFLLGGIYAICELLPRVLPGFRVDYGFWGVVLPVMIYFGRRSVFALIVGLVCLCTSCSRIQWWSLAAVPLLALYNGQRGKHNLGPLFYLYYPIHLALIHIISMFF